MQGADFIFFIQDSRRRFWGINDAGAVTLTANPYPIKYSPDGWQETTIKNIRNRKYWAIDRSASLAFKYVEDAARILKHIFYNLGQEEQVYLVICEQRLDYTPGVSYGFWYKQIFRSEIDLSTFLHDGPVVTCNTLEDGLAKHLKANENTVYEFDLDEYVKMDGVVLKSAMSFLSIEQGHGTTIGTTYNQKWLSFSYLNTDGTSPNLAGLSQTPEEWNSASSHDDARYLTNYFLEATDTATFTIKGTVTATLTDGISLELYVKNSNGTRTQLLILNTDNPSTPTPFSKTETFTVDQSFTMAAGEKLYLISELTDTSFITGPAAGIYNEFQLLVEAEARFRTTYIKYKRPQNLFIELVDKMTGGEYEAEECMFFGSLYNLDKVFTSGDAIRGITGAKLKISFAQFFEFFDTFDSVGIREKAGAILFDRKKNLTDDVNTISLGEVGRPKVKLDKSTHFNELNIGYPDVKNENGVLNGKNEVNTTSVFSFGTTKTPAKLVKVAKVKTSCYDIENLRIQGTNKATTDNKADNDPYALHIGDTLVAGTGDIPDHYELNRAYNVYVTGVDQADSVFNLAFSPMNCLMNSGDYLRSSLWKYEGKKLKFISADRNSAMVYDNGSTQVIENMDVPVSSLGDPFFRPVLMEIEVASLDSLLDDLDEIPTRCMEFTFEGDTYKIIPLENSVNPGTLKKQTFIGYSHPDNDLSKFISYHG